MNILVDNGLPITVAAQLHIEWKKKGSQSQSPERNLEWALILSVLLQQLQIDII